MKKTILAFLLAVISAILFSCDDPIDGPKKKNEPDIGYSYRSAGTYIKGMPEIYPTEGIYYDAVTVNMKSSENYTIRYTTDCSIPSEKSAEYTEPFIVSSENKNTNGGAYVAVIRAAAFDAEGKQIGETITSSYIFPSGEDRFTTEIISLVADPESLYGYEEGILISGKMAKLYNEHKSFVSANYNGRGKEWERAASFTLYSVDGTPEFSQNVGIRLNGTGSRGNNQKNFRVFARKEYTPSTGKMNYAFFENRYSPITGKKIDSYDTLLLRGGSSNINNTMITNAISYAATYDCENLLTAKQKPVAMFLNGKYYGLMMITEDYGPEYFEEYYGVDADGITTLNMTVVQNEASQYLAWEPDDGTEEDAQEFIRAMTECRNADMSIDANYKKFLKYFDEDNVIEYYVTECYLNNWDWPRNNSRVWRYSADGYNPNAEPGFDGRWRFLVKDSDMTLGAANDIGNGTVYVGPVEDDFFYVGEKDDGTPSLLGPMVRHLLANKTFKEKFVKFVCDYASGAGDPVTLLESISTWEAIVAPEMSYHIDIIGKGNKMTALSWSQNLEKNRDFADRRQALVLSSVESRLGVDITAITVGPCEHGTIYLNGIPMRREGQSFWTELNKSVTFEVVPDEGYTFSGFTKVSGLSVGSDTVKLTSKRTTLTTNFTEGGDTPEKEEPRDYTVAIPDKSRNAIVINGKLYSMPADDVKITSDDLQTYFGKYSAKVRQTVGSGINKGMTFAEIAVKLGNGNRLVYVDALNTYIVYNPSLK